MSGFVETLVAPRVHPLANEEEEEEEVEEINNLNKDAIVDKKILQENDDNHMDDQLLMSDNALDFCPLNCVKDQDKLGSKSTMPLRKQRMLQILTKSNNLGVRSSRSEAEVQIARLTIVCPGRPEISLSHPFSSSPKASLFTLKEGTKYRLKFSFIVSNHLVSGLKFDNTLWKAGIRVDRSIVMLGSFSPQEKPHEFHLEEETLPTGFLIRGLYSARAKVTDEDGNCYMDLHYHFDIQKTWPSNS